MRILIISTFFPPLNSIGSLRPYSWAKYWSRAGHEVSVLTTQKPPSDQDLKMSHHGFTVHEVPFASFLNSWKKDYQNTQQPKNGSEIPKTSGWKSSLIKVFHQMRATRGIFNACRMPDFTDLWIKPAFKFIQHQGPWDLVVSTAGPYAVHVVAEKLKRKGLAKKWIADFRDPWSDNFAFPGLFPFNCIEKWWEKKLMQAADLITTVSAPFAEKFAKKYPAKKVLAVENGFDPDDLEALPPHSIFPADHKFRIVHTGSIYQGKRDFLPLFQAIAELNESEPKLLNTLEVIFVGSRVGNLNEQIHHFGLAAWVKNQGMVSREKALCMQRDAQALLFLPWNDLAFPGVLTGKIFEYLFSGTPIIAIGGSGIEMSQQLILDAQAGTVLNTVPEIKDFLRQQLSAPNLHKTVVAQALLEKYNRKILAAKLLNESNLCLK